MAQKSLKDWTDCTVQRHLNVVTVVMQKMTDYIISPDNKAYV